jgi:hypothetical protein
LNAISSSKSGALVEVRLGESGPWRVLEDRFYADEQTSASPSARSESANRVRRPLEVLPARPPFLPKFRIPSIQTEAPQTGRPSKPRSSADRACFDLKRSRRRRSLPRGWRRPSANRKAEGGAVRANHRDQYDCRLHPSSFRAFTICRSVAACPDARRRVAAAMPRTQ